MELLEQQQASPERQLGGGEPQLGSLPGLTPEALQEAPSTAKRLGYRPWTGAFRAPFLSIWPIARVGLKMMFRQKLFWVLYALALLNFVFFFGGIYLFAQIDLEALTNGKATQQQLKMWTDIKGTLQKQLKLAGNAETFRNFYWFQGYFVMAVLALAGALLVGNDYRHGSLPFYLSKPISRWHYLWGKLFTVGVFINLMTTVPALILFTECALLEEDYFQIEWRMLLGILGYAVVLTVPLSLVIVTLASWLKKTAPLIMIWLGLLVFAKLVSNFLVDAMKYSPTWRLMDLWNVLYVLGSWCLGVTAHLGPLGNSERGGGPPAPPRLQPEPWQALIVLAIVMGVCFIYLQRRLRAVEVVR